MIRFKPNRYALLATVFGILALVDVALYIRGFYAWDRCYFATARRAFEPDATTYLVTFNNDTGSISIGFTKKDRHTELERGIIYYSRPPIRDTWHFNGLGRFTGIGISKLDTLSEGTPIKATSIGLKHWMIFLVAAIGFLMSSRAARNKRLLPGHCTNCGYDLRATPQQCPECGQVAEMQNAE